MSTSHAASDRPADLFTAYRYLIIHGHIRGTDLSIMSSRDFTDSSTEIQWPNMDRIELFDKISTICFKLGFQNQALVAAYGAFAMTQRYTRHLFQALQDIGLFSDDDVEDMQSFSQDMTQRLVIRLADILITTRSWDEARAEMCFVLCQISDSMRLGDIATIIRARFSSAIQEGSRLYDPKR